MFIAAEELYFAENWYRREEYYRWSGPGREAVVKFPCITQGCSLIGNIEIVLHREIDLELLESMVLKLNNDMVLEPVVKCFDKCAYITFFVHESLLSHDKENSLVLGVSSCISPMELGINNDARKLGLAVKNIRLIIMD